MLEITPCLAITVFAVETSVIAAYAGEIHLQGFEIGKLPQKLPDITTKLGPGATSGRC